MAVQALCAPRSDCGLDRCSRLLRRERVGYYGETYHRKWPHLDPWNANYYCRVEKESRETALQTLAAKKRNKEKSE